MVTIRVMFTSSDAELPMNAASAAVALVTSLLSLTTRPEVELHTPICRHTHRLTNRRTERPTMTQMEIRSSVGKVNKSVVCILQSVCLCQIHSTF